jgi:DNA-directed RNA polymerase subunit RPC12/RpoP
MANLSVLRSRNETNYFRKEEAKFSCSECKAAFHQPILATLSSSGHIQKYYACPRCLTEVEKVEDQEIREPIEEETIKDDVVTDTSESEEDVECKHHFGYLKKRPENTPIPEECLTCNKMIKCLLH